MANVEDWLRYLEIVSQRVRHCHDALWEEEKHYSWWIYPILAGTIWVLASEPLQSDPCLQTIIVAVASSLGIYLSWAGFHTISREHGFFRSWLYLQDQIEVALRQKASEIQKIEQTLPFPVYDPNSPIRPSQGVGITQVFKVNFVVTGIIFVVIIALNAYHFCGLCGLCFAK
jgi:hypothetical protein